MSDLYFEEIREQKSLFGVNTQTEDEDIQLDDIKDPASVFDFEPDPDNVQGEAEMQTLGLCDNPSPQKDGFWRRQFQNEVTPSQRKWDWAYGVVLPLICFFFDPFVFRLWNGSGGLLGAYKPFAYSASAIAIALMAAWLLWREKLGSLSALFAGAFFAASTLSFVVGILLIPFSLVGIVVLIGVLGFTPLFTSVIFLRNGVRALRAARPELAKSKLAYASIVGTLWGLAIPFALQMEVNRSLDLIANGSPETIRVQGLKLRLLAPIVDADQLRTEFYHFPADSQQGEEIRSLYRQMTGKEMDRRQGFNLLD